MWFGNEFSSLAEVSLYWQIWCVSNLRSPYHTPRRILSQLEIWHFWVIGIERNVCRCTSNRYIVMDLQEVGGGCEDWMKLAQVRDRWRALVSTVMKFRVPKMRGISWLAAEPVSFARRTLLHGINKCHNAVCKTRRWRAVVSSLHSQKIIIALQNL